VSAARSCRVSDREFDATRTRSDDEVAAHHCITCGDDGVPVEVVRTDEVRGLALCAHEDGSRETVETALVDPVVPGDVLLVHAGTALARLDATP
jgi:hydrogenase maturation factor